MANINTYSIEDVEKAITKIQDDIGLHQELVDNVNKELEDLVNTQRELNKLLHMIYEEDNFVAHKHVTIMHECQECGQIGLPNILKFKHRLFGWWVLRITCHKCGHEYYMRSFEFNDTINLSNSAEMYLE